MPDNLASTQGPRECVLWPKIHHEFDLKKIAEGHQMVVSWSEILEHSPAGSSTKTVVKDQQL